MRKTDYAVGDTVAFEPALACRIVENADAEYRWFWDRILHRRYVWKTRGRHDVRIYGTDLAYAPEQSVSAAPSTPRSEKEASFYSDDPAASATDKKAYNDLLAFIFDYLIPACDAQMALQEAMVRELCEGEIVANFAVHGWRDAPDYATLGFWKHYNNLRSGLCDSPGPTLTFEGMIECISGLEQQNYDKFCKQAGHLLWHMHRDKYQNFSDLWQGWGKKNEALKAAYEPIKRDARFGKLLRPGRTSRWGDAKEPLPENRASNA